MFLRVKIFLVMHYILTLIIVFLYLGAARPADPNVLYSATLESDDVNKYDVTQVYMFEIAPER